MAAVYRETVWLGWDESFAFMQSHPHTRGYYTTDPAYPLQFRFLNHEEQLAVLRRAVWRITPDVGLEFRFIRLKLAGGISRLAVSCRFELQSDCPVLMTMLITVLHACYPEEKEAAMVRATHPDQPTSDGRASHP